MKTKYKILGDLKRIDDKIMRLGDELEQIPPELQKTEKELSQRKEDFGSITVKVETAEKKLRKLELELREKEDRLRKAQEKMMEVTTNEQYQAALKENEAQKAEQSELEDQILGLLSAVEEERRLLKDAEKKFQDCQAAAQKYTQHLNEDRDRLLKLLEEQKHEQTVAALQLDSETSSLYARVSSRLRGAIAFVESGICLSCHTRVRPQLYNEVLGYQTIHRCANCGRILITQESGSENAERLAQS